MSKVLPKDELLSRLAPAAGVTRAQADAVLTQFANEVRAETARGRTVALPGLGRFSQKTRAARVGRNPQTGVPIDIAESTVLTFKVSKTAS